MIAVGLKVLKNKLAEYVRLAASGEVILVTDRDRVVAELVPPQGRSLYVNDALLAQAVREGVVSPPVMRARTPKPKRVPVAPLAEILAELDDDRGH